MVEPEKIGFVIPGQGSQLKGVLRELYDNSGIVREVFGRVSDHFHLSMPHLCFEDPENHLSSENPQGRPDTRAVQLYMFTLSVAIGEFLLKNGFPPPKEISGHSAGKIAAGKLAKALPGQTDLEVVDSRSREMAEDINIAEKTNQQRAVALMLGYNLTDIKAIRKSLGEKARSVRETILNPAKQTMLGGLREHVEAVIQAANSSRRAYEFKETVLSHHPLLGQAQKNFNFFLDSLNFGTEKLLFPVRDDLPFDPNDLHGEALDSPQPNKLLETPQAFAQSLRPHLDHAIDFRGSVEAMVKSGVTRIIEIGPKEVLKNLIERRNKSLLPGETPVRVDSTSTWENIRTLLKEFGLAPEAKYY